MNNNILVGRLNWFPETDMTQLHTPPIFQGIKVKGRFRKGPTFLLNSTTKEEVADFYKDFQVTLAHILSKTAALYNQSGAAIWSAHHPPGNALNRRYPTASGNP